MTLLSSLTRPFKLKAANADGKFKFCADDEVIVGFEGPEGADDFMVPAVVLNYTDDCSGAFCVQVKGISDSNELVTATVSSVSIFNPKDTKMNCSFIPLHEVDRPEHCSSISDSLS